MHNDDLSIRTSGHPKVIKLGDGDSIIIDDDPPQISAKSLESMRPKDPDPNKYLPVQFYSALQIGESRQL